MPPVTSILSTFTGANEDPLTEGGAWSSTPIVNGSTALMQRLSNVAAKSASGTGQARQAWVASYAADQEVFCTVPTLPGAGQGVGVFARVQNPGNATTCKAYAGFYTPGTGFRIFSISGTTFTQRGSTSATTMSAGDKLWLSCNGTSIVLSVFTSGAWTSKVSVTDSNVTGGGQLGIELDDATGRIDDFGGGALKAGGGLLLLGAG